VAFRRIFVVFAASLLAPDVTWVLVEVKRGWGGWGMVVVVVVVVVVMGMMEVDSPGRDM